MLKINSSLAVQNCYVLNLSNNLRQVAVLHSPFSFLFFFFHMVLPSSRNGSIILDIYIIFTAKWFQVGFPEMHNLLLTVCLLYIFIEEFSQVHVFLRGKIEQVTLVCM